MTRRSLRLSRTPARRLAAESAQLSSGSAVTRRLLLGTVTLLCFATLSDAQTVANPRIVEFNPSADHNTAVTRYDFEVYAAGATAPFHTIGMAKPALQSDGKIRYDFSGTISGWPLPGGVYESRVAAVGANGTEGAPFRTPSRSARRPVPTRHRPRRSRSGVRAGRRQ